MSILDCNNPIVYSIQSEARENDALKSKYTNESCRERGMVVLFV